jgi:hypothetical protein
MLMLTATLRLFSKAAFMQGWLCQGRHLQTLNSVHLPLVRGMQIRKWGQLSDLSSTSRASYLAPFRALKKRSQRRRRRYTKLRYSLLLRRLVMRMLHILTGSSVYLFFCRNLQRRLSSQELAFVWLQSQRIFLRMPADLSSFRRVENYPWRYGSTALYVSSMIRDPRLLVNWMQNRMRTMTLFQHRRFLRTLALSLYVAASLPKYKYNLRG